MTRKEIEILVNAGHKISFEVVPSFESGSYILQLSSPSFPSGYDTLTTNKDNHHSREFKSLDTIYRLICMQYKRPLTVMPSHLKQ